MLKHISLFALLVSLGLALTACGGSDVRSEVNTSTKGQQLLDLKAALDAGVISIDEYERERKRILHK